MVSKKSGHLFEKRLVVKFIETEGTVRGRVAAVVICQVFDVWG